MDNAIWAIWYDIEKEHEPAYLEWMHKIYLPKIQSEAGCLWVAHYRAGANEMRQVMYLLSMKVEAKLVA